MGRAEDLLGQLTQLSPDTSEANSIHTALQVCISSGIYHQTYYLRHVESTYFEHIYITALLYSEVNLLLLHRSCVR